MLFALNGLYWSHKKLSIISSIDVKRLFQMSTPVFVFFNHKKKELLVRYQKFLGFYYKQIILSYPNGIFFLGTLLANTELLLIL